VGLLSRLADAFRPERATGINSLSFEQWLQWMTYQGKHYPFMPGSGTSGRPQEEPEPTFEGYVQGIYRSNGVVFACMTARLLLFSEARLLWRELRQGRPGDLFWTPELTTLEVPWPNGTTGDLLGRAIQDADLAGNFYAVRRRGTLKRLRPDWVTIVLGSELAADEPGFASDAEVIGYIYKPGGPRGTADAQVFLPEEIAHFAPLPDPTAHFRGMSWLTPVIREIMADQAATEHKLEFFERGATPNFVVSLDAAVGYQAFKEYEQAFRERHADLDDFYKTIMLGGGADVSVVGANMEQLQFKETQGAGETRICAAARVPPIIVGLSEGLDAATYSNYGQARRAFADLTMRPLWRNFAGSVASVLERPQRPAELWYDDRDIPFLQEDVDDAATIIETQARAIRTLNDGGYEPDSVVDAVVSGDLRRLKHTGKLSVQLQEPGSQPSTNGAAPAAEEEPAAV
jgi:hypothetical protein